MKKNYEQPAMLLTKVQLGVYGEYGLTDRDEIYSIQLPDRHRS